MRKISTAILFCLLLAGTASAVDSLTVFKMIENGDVQGVQAAIKSGFEINKTYPESADYPTNKRTPLYQAVFFIRPEIVKLLLGAGANTELMGTAGNRPLDWAAAIATMPLDRFKKKWGRTENLAAQTLENIDLLLAAGAKVNAPDLFGVTPLMIACMGDNLDTSIAVTKKLLSKGADPNYLSSPDKAPAIFWTMPPPLEPGVKTSDRSALIKVLLDAGANPKVRTVDGYTPLHAAAGAGDMESAKLLIAAGTDPRAKNDDGQTAAEIAFAEGMKELAVYLRMQEKK